MASSGTYAWSPDIQEFLDEAFERCGVSPKSLVQEHLTSARRSMNFLLADWATKDVHLWLVDEQTQTLTAGQETYTAPDGTVLIMDAVVRRSGIDTPVHHIDRTAYHNIPSKTQEGLPTNLFFDAKTGQYKLWNVPENSTDVLRFWRMRRAQDVTAGQETPDVPYKWFEALAAGTAHFLAKKYAPDRIGALETDAAKSFNSAKMADRQRTDTRFTMRLGR